MRRLLRSPAGLAGALLVTAFIVLAAIGPVIWADYAATIDPANILQGRSADHFLGTDDLGRDVLARVLVAARLSLLLALLATGIGVLIGVPLGALPAILPRRAGRMVVGTVNSLVAFPSLLLAMFITIVMGLGARGAVFGIGVAIAPALARLTYTLSASVAGSDYVASARMLHVPRWRILTRHVLPNVAEPLILNITMILGTALLGIAALSFLGLGVQPPDYDWGRMLSEALPRVYVHPEVILGPAIAIMAAGIGFQLLGERLARMASREVPRPAGTPAGAPPAVAATEPPAEPTVLDVRNLTVTFPGGVTPVRDVTLSVRPGEIVGIVGESGSGKSLTTLAIAGLVPYPGAVTTAHLAIGGEDMSALSAQERRKLLGSSMAMVFQDPMSSLNPALRVGSQLAEVTAVHNDMSWRASWRRATERLRQVRIPEPDRRARQRPNEFSGGMRQRATIAMGLMGTPKLLVADEPTTALDVTVQRQILELLTEVTAGTDAGAIFISHDVAVVSQICDRVIVMYAGRVVEELSYQDLAAGPAHPYTRALVACLPDMRTDRERPLATIPGRPPAPESGGDGCPFAPRCELATEICTRERPPLEPGRSGGRVACWHPISGPVEQVRV